MNQITLKGFPLPPSANTLYANVPGRGRIKSRGYKLFEAECHIWRLRNNLSIVNTKIQIKSWSLIRVDMVFHMEESRIICKDGRPKRNDTSNRLKAAHDLLAEILQVDDSKFWSGSFDKCPVPSDAYEQVVIILSHHSVDPGKLTEAYGIEKNNDHT